MIKPWREITKPLRDVLEGTFEQPEFAADITQVTTATAPSEYQDAEQFFARTFIAGGAGVGPTQRDDQTVNVSRWHPLFWLRCRFWMEKTML